MCVTHVHDDHIGDSLEIVKKTGAKLLCSPEIGFYADKKGIAYDEASYPLNIGGSWRTDDFTITMVWADHTSDILGEEFKKGLEEFIKSTDEKLEELKQTVNV